MTTLTLTPFEEELLTVMGSLDHYELAHFIVVQGALLCGCSDDWAGPSYARNALAYTPTYPKIDFALGRLRQKGLVQRQADAFMQDRGYTAGQWKLTDLGRTLLGIA